MKWDRWEQLKCDPGCLQLYAERINLKRDGKQYVGLCPFHDDHNPSLHVFQQDGVWLYRCVSCEAKGDIYNFLEAFEKIRRFAAKLLVEEGLGLAGWERRGEDWERKCERAEQVFHSASRALDAEAPVKKMITYPMSEYAGLELALSDNPTARAWLLDQRGITCETATRLHFGYREDVRNWAGEANLDIADAGWIALPCIQGEDAVSIKYRSMARKVFCRQPGMGTALFNTETINPGEPVFLTEGEFDAAVLEQAGYHAVSLPSAVNITPAMRTQLLKAKYIILAGDCDGKVGSAIMDKLWRELQGKSYLLHWPEGCKDANDTWLKYANRDMEVFRRAVDTLVADARKVPMPGVYSLQQSLRNSREESLADHPARLHFPWKVIDRMAILLPGSVMTVFATQTKQGKTAWTMQLTMHNARKFGEVVLNYQCELQPSEFATMVAAHVLKKDRNHLSRADLGQAATELENVQYYVGSDPNLTRVNEVLDLIEAAIQRLGATIVVLDHLHFICRNEENEVQAQANAMQRIKRMANAYQVKFIVVGQPRKADQRSKGKPVHITDAKGSESFASDADAVFALHRANITSTDPENPPEEDYAPLTQIRLLGARSKGDGVTYAELMFTGKLATFHEVSCRNERDGLFG